MILSGFVFTFSSSACRISQLISLGNSNLAVVSVNISFASSIREGPLIQKSSFYYQRCDWHSSPHFLLDAYSIQIIKLPIQNHATEVSSWAKSDIDPFLPSMKYQVKSQTSLWFTSVCYTSITHRNRFLRVSQGYSTRGSKTH